MLFSFIRLDFCSQVSEEVAVWCSPITPKRMSLPWFVWFAAACSVMHGGVAVQDGSDWKTAQPPGEQRNKGTSHPRGNSKTTQPRSASLSLNSSTTLDVDDNSRQMPPPPTMPPAEAKTHRDNPGLSMQPWSTWPLQSPSPQPEVLNAEEHNFQHSATDLPQDEESGCISIQTTSTLNGTEYEIREIFSAASFVASDMKNCLLEDDVFEYKVDEFTIDVNSTSDLDLPRRDNSEPMGNWTKSSLTCRITLIPSGGRVFLLKRFSVRIVDARVYNILCAGIESKDRRN